MRLAIRFAGTAVALAFVFVTLSTDVSAQPMRRLSSEYNYFESGEAATDKAPNPKGQGGDLIYKRNVFVPFKTVFFTITMTGDGHRGQAHLFSCLVDGEPCNPASHPTGVQSGWVNLQRHGVDDDFHDNSISYSWCAPVKKQKNHTIELRLASSEGQGTVFVEEAYFFIDSSETTCTRLNGTI
jgi:hypothetical protein